jgi:DNA mismatch repair protein MutL
LIRVIDNGGGIPAADLPLAFASHATSKLVDDDDLFRIATKGFRGEALASIGSVSHSKITSRYAEAPADSAYEIHNRGGAIGDVQAAAGNVGTSVEVRNLFFNVPARRKFLKGHADGVRSHQRDDPAARPAAPARRVQADAQQPRDPGPAGGAGARPAAARAGRKIFASSGCGIDLRDAELRLHGLIGLPELARPTAKYQFFYLNGRPIRDRFIQHALREAYRG